VERLPGEAARRLGLEYGVPPGEDGDPGAAVTKWSVDPRAWGEFLVGIFDEWVRRDVGNTYVQHFDNALAIWAGYGSSLCVFQERCGNALIIEHTGEVFSCDHFMYPAYKLGNVTETALKTLATSPQQVKFGNDKADTLPAYCLRCPVRFACNGECPKHRFTTTPDGEPGLNYLCAGYKRFFSHVHPYMKTMAELLRQEQAPARIMEMLARGEPMGG
jgi:uncharacterized protein